ncbi:MAG: hypothetical protein V4604_04720 [Bacteroidota bacterium]
MHLVVLLGSLSLLFSCIGSRELMRETPDNQDLISVHAVNGDYINQSPTDTLRPALWDVLYQSYSFQEDTSKLVTDNAIINLTLNQKSLIVLAKVGDTIVSEFELKGKIKGDYFCANRKLFLIPIPFLFFRHRERRVVLAVTSENQLIVNHGTEEFLWVIMAGGYNFNSSDQYEKTK